MAKCAALAASGSAMATEGPIRTLPSTWCAWLAARSSAQFAALDNATSTARSVPVASSTFKAYAT